MTSAVLKMNAFLRVKTGMKVVYDCPIMGDDYRSNQFFSENRGKTGTVKGFPEKYVGPLDSKGRLPGVYIQPGYIDVQFEKEKVVHRSLNLQHFILIDVGKTVVPDTAVGSQKARDLPHRVRFYPGDTVRKKKGRRKLRLVEDVKVGNKGEVTYVLAETPEAKKQREDERNAAIKKQRSKEKKSGDSLSGLFLSGMPSFPKTENCRGKDLVLVKRGNVYYLYHRPAKLAFASPEEEITFWSKDGISRTVYGGDNSMPRWEWPLDTARKMVEKGKGDLVIASKQYKNVVVTGRGGDYKVCKLHPCFAQYREQVQKLSLGLAKPPVEEEVPFGKSAMALLGDD